MGVQFKACYHLLLPSPNPSSSKLLHVNQRVKTHSFVSFPTQPKAANLEIAMDLIHFPPSLSLG